MRQRKRTILAYGEGEDEKIFLRHLESCYCRRNLVSVQTGSAGGGTPETILSSALRARRDEKRDAEFIVLDTIPPWPPEVIIRADEEGILLVGNAPCLEALFLRILQPNFDASGKSAWTCKHLFEQEYCSGNNFDEDNCARIFTKAILNEARPRIDILNYMISTIKGNVVERPNP